MKSRQSTPQFRVVIIEFTEIEKLHNMKQEFERLFEEFQEQQIEIWNMEGGLTSEHLQEVLTAAGVSEQEVVLFGASKQLLSLATEEMASIGLDEHLFQDNHQDFKADMLVESLEEVDYDFFKKVFQRKHEIPWTIGETKRCIIREMTMEDLDAMYELYAGKNMTKYMEPLYTEREKEEEYTKAYISNMYRFYGYGMWLVFEKHTGRLIGRAGLENRESGEENYFEMGYAIAADKQRQGYATEVCKMIMEYASKCNPGAMLHCLIQQGNTASIALAEKLGFQFHKVSIIDGTSMEVYRKII